MDIKQFLCTAARWGCEAGTSSLKGTMPAFAIVIIPNTEQSSLIFLAAQPITIWITEPTTLATLPKNRYEDNLDLCSMIHGPIAQLFSSILQNFFFRAS